MEPASLAIGVIGLSALVQSCLDCYNGVMAIRRADGDLYTMQLKMKTEQRRFKTTIQRLEADKASEESQGAERMPTKDDSLSIMVVFKLEASLREIKDIMIKYEPATSSADSPLPGSSHSSKGKTGGKSASKSGTRSFTEASSPRTSKTVGRSSIKKLVFTATDKAHLQELFNDLEYFNNCLYGLVTDSAAKRVGDEYRQRVAAINTLDIAKLEIVESAWSSTKRMDIAWAARAKVLLLRQQLELSQEAAVQDEANPKTRWQVSSADISSIGKDHEIQREEMWKPGIYHIRQGQKANATDGSAGVSSTSAEIAVLVQWRDAFKGDLAPKAAARRLDSLVDFLAAMHSAQKEDPPSSLISSTSMPISTPSQQYSRNVDFGMLKCLGWTALESPKGNAFDRVGLVFQYPHNDRRPPQSLRDRIEEGRKSGFPTHALGDRFDLAFGICSAIANIISIGWMHRAVRSDNMLLLDERSIRRVYLIGFTYSRAKDVSGELSNLPVQEHFALYRPPRNPDRVYDALEISDEEIESNGQDLSSPAPAQPKEIPAAADMYGLGIVLLEIGLWQSIDMMMKRRKSPDVERFQKHDIKSDVELLSSRCGNIYRDVVTKCLHGENWTQDTVQENLAQLLASLKECRA